MKLQMKQVAGLMTALKTPFSVSEAAPQDPVPNQVWLEPTTLTIYVYLVGENSSAWVEIN